MLGDSIHSLSCMNSRVQNEKMQLELKNEQLLLMKRFLLVFCLFPAFLLMAALLLDPGHKVVTVFFYISVTLGALLVLVYPRLNALPPYLLKGSGEELLIPDATFLRWDRTNVSISKESLISASVEPGIDDYVLVLKMNSMPRFMAENMVLGHIRICDQLIELSFSSEKAARKCLKQLMEFVNA